MRTVEGVLGNLRDDPDLADAAERHAAAGTLERVEIDAAERVKSRLRATTDAGTELGIVVDRPALRDGDVLLADDDRLVVVAFASREALAIDLPASVDAATLLELGHRVGNQHWDLAVRDGTAYVPLDADRRIVEDVLAGALPATAATSVETVDGDLFVDDGDAATDGAHATGADHGHGGGGHGHGSDHEHDHGDGHGHHEQAHVDHDHEHTNADHDHGDAGHAHDHADAGQTHDHADAGHTHDYTDADHTSEQGDDADGERGERE